MLRTPGITATTAAPGVAITLMPGVVTTPPVPGSRSTSHEMHKSRVSAFRIIMSFTDLHAKNNAGEEVAFKDFAGQVVLVVNVARL